MCYQSTSADFNVVLVPLWHLRRNSQSSVIHQVQERKKHRWSMLSTEWLSIVPWVPMEAITLPLFDRVVEPMSNGMWPMMTKLEASHGLKSQGRSPSCYSMRQSTLSHHWSRSPSFGGKAFRFKTAKKTALPPWWQILWTLGFVICAKERRLFEEEQIQKEARRKAEAQRCDRCGHVIGV